MTLLLEKDAICYPGQAIAEGNYKISTGVYKENDRYFAMYVGILSIKKNNLSVRPFKGKYTPKVGDVVIGTIEETMLTAWKVDIGSPYSAILLASNAIGEKFDPIKDDARNFFNTGDAIRAEIISFDRTRDPQLSTLDKNHNRLDSGQIINCSPNFVSRIIGHKGSMVRLIKKFTNTQITVGHNGRIWVSGNNLNDEIRAIEAIRQVEREAHTKGLTNRIEEMLKSSEKTEVN